MTKLTNRLIDIYLKSHGTSRETITENEMDTSILNSHLINLNLSHTTTIDFSIITVENIDDHCFTLNIFRDQLTDFTIRDGVTEIRRAAFAGCHSLKSITIPDSVTKIDREAFYECTSLESINIPNSVTEIGGEAFRACTSLKSITIPNGVTVMSIGSFWGCTSLTSITIPDSVTKIDWSTFSACTSLKSITIPVSVTKIGKCAFLECSSLKSITIPDSVTEIGEGAFSRCYIPDSVTTIGEDAFNVSISLTQVICNNPDLFNDQNISDKEQVEFISTTDFITQNYSDFFNLIQSKALNIDLTSVNAFNLIIKLHQEDFHPNWKNIATSFKDLSMDQIRFLLNHFNKTTYPNIEKSISLQKNEETPITINDISMFLNPIEYTNLSMSSDNVILKTKEKDSASFCSIQ